ncbi:alpha/beta hydrolase [Herbiconiux sp. L3-i23]|uniref:alpha/beta hydrolase n=1 Tax=Herbiconiux sp. L3-i23 TaxID=2905871 RepID=UPI00205BEC71|nr:alpha/beta hydrolase-fold protein [Herbiconiux sp. L3-i23]BDI23942.1 esterase [Herbiconiux sp. L3-i23]
MPGTGKPSVDARAVIWSAKPTELADRPLLVLLHGVGSHEGDLFGLAPHLPLQPVIASLRALAPYGAGWSWYELGTPGDPKSDGVDAAAAAVLDWLDSLGPAPTSVGLMGFSQGAAVSLQALRHAPERFDFVVQLSGYVTSGELEGDARLAELRPPVFWGRGTDDEIIPAEAVARTEEWLPGHSDLDRRIYEDLPHAVSQAELADVIGFLRRHYG